MESQEERSYTQISIEQEELFKVFETGKIGEKFKALMESEEANQYFNEHIYKWAMMKNNMLNNIVAKKVLNRMICRESVYRCIASMFFAKSIEQWVRTGGDLEGIIISKLTFEELVTGVEIFRKSMQKMIQHIMEHTFCETNDSQFDEAYNSACCMPEMPGSNRLH